MIRLLKLLLLAAATAWLPAYAQNANELNFGIISTESSTNLKENWQPLIDDMQKRTGLKINAFFASDYAGIIEAMRFNKVQVAWFGNKSAMEAVDRANGEVFAQMIAPDGGQGYYSLLVVHKDSPLRSVDDVLKNGKNLNFGNGDPNSTSGFLVPSYYVFALNKIDPKTHFKTARGASHETNLLAVVNKQVDVATNNTENMERFISKFPDKAKDVRPSVGVGTGVRGLRRGSRWRLFVDPAGHGATIRASSKSRGRSPSRRDFGDACAAPRIFMVL